MTRKRKPKTLSCPTCKATVTMRDEQFPFCSERCRSIDLGKWASGSYRISSPIVDPDVLERIAEGEDPERKPN